MRSAVASAVGSAVADKDLIIATATIKKGDYVTVNVTGCTQATLLGVMNN